MLAHRGANRDARENTLAAFEAAAELAADGVELDVRRTGDGVLVVLHDPAIDGLGPVAQRRADELPPWVPSLDDALDVCASMALVNVEIKLDAGQSGDTLAGAVARSLSQRKAENILVSSFSLEVIDAHRVAAPGIRTGWLTALPLAAEVLDAVVARGHVAIHPHELLIDESSVAAARERGLLVAAWTVDDPTRAAHLAGLGVDVIITDDPAEIRAALTAAD